MEYLEFNLIDNLLTGKQDSVNLEPMKSLPIRVRRYKHSKTSKYVVDGLRINGKRRRKFFAIRQEADIYAESKNIELQNDGLKAIAIPDSLRDMAAECAKKLKPYSSSIADATNYFVRHLEATKRSITIEQLKKEFIEVKHGKGISVRYKLDLKHRLSRFAKDFGAWNTATITSSHIDNWLKDLYLSAQSQNNYRAVLSSMFTYAVNRGYAQDNPVARVEKSKIVGEAPEIFTVSEIAKLLNAATIEVLPILAIGAFAGLRMAEIFRLEWKDIDLNREFIHISAKNAKSAKRRLVKILPNLAAWISLYAKPDGKLWAQSDSTWRVRLRTVMKKAKLTKWPENGLRHSYASYHLARFQNANALALEMGHADTSMIFSHYRELVNPEKAASYWEITPKAVSNVTPFLLAAAK